jgi:Uma2 family endonuclease
VAEYLAFERAAPDKHEYADGELFAMSGCTRAHSLIAGNLAGELRAALLDRPCEVHASDMRVKITTTSRYVYPDISVACGDIAFEDEHVDTLLNPRVIVEVLSDSTEAYDRGDKFAHYQRIPSFTDYVLVSQKDVRVEHFQRQSDGKWLLTILGPGSQLALEAVGVSVPVDRLYLKVQLPAASAEGASPSPDAAAR